MKRPLTSLHKKKEPGAAGKELVLEKRSLRRIVGALALLILLVWILARPKAVVQVIRRIFGLVTPFLIGGILAFLINVVMRPIERLWDRMGKNSTSKLYRAMKRPVGLVVSTLLILGIIFLVVFMVLPGLAQSGNDFIQNAPTYLEETGQWWNGIVELAAQYNIALPEFTITAESIAEKIAPFLGDDGSGIITSILNATSSIVSATTSILSGVINGLLAFIFAMYLLAQKERIGAHLKRSVTVLFPKKAERILNIAKLSDVSFTNFVTGQCVEAVIIGSLCFLGMLLLKLPYAGAVSVMVGATALIPVFGAWLGCAMGAFLIFLTSPIQALWFVVFLVILQQLENNLIYPRVVGKSVGLPGILVLMAVTIGGSGFGLPGMLFGVPVCAVLYSLYLELLDKKEKKAQLLQSGR